MMMLQKVNVVVMDGDVDVDNDVDVNVDTGVDGDFEGVVLLSSGGSGGMSVAALQPTSGTIVRHHNARVGLFTQVSSTIQLN